ncbi:hypothetical protein [Bradyrhizobium sp. 2S1]|uniref:hypothetical protein n=1 Tax=Bradyrhizobium sp. 2S1 TaxID=1404429 RepID=UPI00140923A0|nr:hypothetical protein [Bradyrhizobium sp. 2S1]MCK7671501.1 hypothetical protein [Bradyrhizobium sp. 2S1]
MATIINLKGTKEAPKNSRSSMETRIISISGVQQWKVPPFQRPVRVNAKVQEAAQSTRENEAIEGVITLGQVRGDLAYYIVDGQHRIEGFKISGIEEALVDVRVVTFEDFAEMANEFVKLNSSLVRMRPDDLLRGMEDSTISLQLIRKHCPFVGYDQIRRASTGAPIVGMSVILRCWAGSAGETPTSTMAGQSVSSLAKTTDETSARQLIQFLGNAHQAWGRDPEYYRLWGALNLSLCMWLYRRLVIDRDRMGNKRVVVLNQNEFKQCLMSVSASGDYLQWLVGRNMTERDRSPAYMRLKAIFQKRLQEITQTKSALPAPAWSSR